MYKNFAEMKRANEAIGHHWFDADAMRFFSSKLQHPIYRTSGGAYFVSSEQRDHDEPRLFSVRFCDHRGSVDTIGHFQQYSTKAQAVDAIIALIAA